MMNLKLRYQIFISTTNLRKREVAYKYVKKEGNVFPSFFVFNSLMSIKFRTFARYFV